LRTVILMKSTLPRAVRSLTLELVRLPGIGPKTAQRLALYLLRQPRTVVSRLADVLKNLHVNVRTCTRCFNLAEQELCVICRDDTRTASQVCVVEDPLDVDALERTNLYGGLYHVLGGVLSPLEGIDAEQLTIKELRTRVEQEGTQELIMALNATTEAEATVRYIMQIMEGLDVTITRLGRGLPTGGDIEFADALTLAAAFQGRKNIE
jgi:recombination protein RecR